jgi:hypothetical protein
LRLEISKESENWVRFAKEDFLPDAGVRPRKKYTRGGEGVQPVTASDSQWEQGTFFNGFTIDDRQFTRMRYPRTEGAHPPSLALRRGEKNNYIFKA